MKNILLSSLLVGALQTAAAADTMSLSSPIASPQKAQRVSKNINHTKGRIDILIQDGTSEIQFAKNLTSAGVCQASNNPYAPDVKIDALRKETELSSSMQACLSGDGEAPPGLDLFCEIAHIERIETIVLNYFLATEQQRAKDCNWKNTGKQDTIKSLKSSINAYLKEKNLDRKNELKVLVSEKLLEYMILLDASDISALNGYDFLLEYLRGSSENISQKNSKKTSQEIRAAELRVVQSLGMNLDFFETLRDWSEYVYSKKFSPEINDQYQIIIGRMWTFRDSPKELETYKSALEALHEKHGTSYGEMLTHTNYARFIQRKKST